MRFCVSSLPFYTIPSFFLFFTRAAILQELPVCYKCTRLTRCFFFLRGWDNIKALCREKGFSQLYLCSCYVPMNSFFFLPFVVFWYFMTRDERHRRNDASIGNASSRETRKLLAYAWPAPQPVDFWQMEDGQRPDCSTCTQHVSDRGCESEFRLTALSRVMRDACILANQGKYRSNCVQSYNTLLISRLRYVYTIHEWIFFEQMAGSRPTITEIPPNQFLFYSRHSSR